MALAHAPVSGSGEKCTWRSGNEVPGTAVRAAAKRSTTCAARCPRAPDATPSSKSRLDAGSDEALRRRRGVQRRAHRTATTAGAAAVRWTAWRRQPPDRPSSAFSAVSLASVRTKPWRAGAAAYPGGGHCGLASRLPERLGFGSWPPVAARPWGAIAQSGERLNGIQEVGGSTPPGSTSSLSDMPTDSHVTPQRMWSWERWQG